MRQSTRRPAPSVGLLIDAGEGGGRDGVKTPPLPLNRQNLSIEAQSNPVHLAHGARAMGNSRLLKLI
jgi:hypothetical protein